MALTAIPFVFRGCLSSKKLLGTKFYIEIRLFKVKNHDFRRNSDQIVTLSRQNVESALFGADLTTIEWKLRYPGFQWCIVCFSVPFGTASKSRLKPPNPRKNSHFQPKKVLFLLKKKPKKVPFVTTILHAYLTDFRKLAISQPKMVRFSKSWIFLKAEW